MKNISLTTLLALGLFCPALAQTQIIDGLNHPESIALDGDLLYVADIGKELDPMAKDGDGVIATYTKGGKLVNKEFVKGIDAPKGLAISGAMLVACDVDQLRVFDKKTGKQMKAISFEGTKTKFLNDFVFAGPNVGYVSATDINTVFKVFLESGQITPIKVSEALRGPNGLAFNSKTNMLVVNEYGGQNGEPGRVLEVEAATGKAKVRPGVEGGLDGMAMLPDGGYLVSDWGKVPEGRVVWMSNNGEKHLNGKPIGGPADFAHDVPGRVIYLPAMMEGKVYTISY